MIMFLNIMIKIGNYKDSRVIYKGRLWTEYLVFIRRLLLLLLYLLDRL